MSLLDAIQNPLEIGAPSGNPDGADLAAINAYASTPLDAKQVFVYPCQMATRAMSDYCIRMGDSSLRNFARDAKRGTVVHVMHDRLIRGVGYTYAGHYDALTGDARAAAFIIRGRTIEDAPILSGNRKLSTSQEIDDIRNGLRRDVSVGPGGPFYWYKCDLCGGNVMDGFWSGNDDGCTHLPGVRYEGQVATCSLENAMLVELSNVDAGAIPGAAIGRPATGTGEILRAQEYRTAQDHPIGTLAFGAELCNKAVALFRGNRLNPADYRQWLQFRAFTDPTVTTVPLSPPLPSASLSPPPSSSTQPGREEEPYAMKKLRALLAAAGLNAAAALIPDGDAAPTEDQVLAALRAELAAQEAARVQAQAANDGLLSALAEAQVADVSAFKTLVLQAADGRAYAAQVDKDLEAECNRRFKDQGAETFASLALLPLKRKEEMTATFRRLTDKEFGIEGTNGGTRQSAPSGPARIALPVDMTDDEQTALKTEAKSIVKRTAPRQPAAAR